MIGRNSVEDDVIHNDIFYRNGDVNGILLYAQRDRRHPVRNHIP